MNREGRQVLVVLAAGGHIDARGHRVDYLVRASGSQRTIGTKVWARLQAAGLIEQRTLGIWTITSKGREVTT